jgi:hypothetical protein
MRMTFLGAGIIFAAVVAYVSIWLTARDMGYSRPIAYTVASVGTLSLASAAIVARTLIAKHIREGQSRDGPEADYQEPR